MIELLEIRLARNLNQRLETEIEHVINDVMKDASGNTMKLYKKANLNSDYLIIIMNTHNIYGNRGSELGQRIKAALSDFGLINHSIWNGINPKII
jgi:hypothetical protein